MNINIDAASIYALMPAAGEQIWNRKQPVVLLKTVASAIEVVLKSMKEGCDGQ